MMRRAFRALLLSIFFIAPLAMQAQGDYLDVFIAQVKPEKVTDFTSISKKVADANRRNSGDHWIAQQVIYGEGEVYAFVSFRQDYAEIDKGSDAFMNAMSKAYGKDAASKMLHDFEGCLMSSRSELRKRRPDLSRKMPSDMAAYAKLVGGSRVLRTTAVHVRPGHVADFEAILKDVKSAGEQVESTQPLFISQGVEGTKGTTFYVSALRSGLDGFDKNPTMHEILGEEGYKKFLQGSADAIESTESTLLRFSPELSNPPEEIMAAAPDFWQPKSVLAAGNRKPKSSATKASAEKANQ